jgi:predicted nucleotidyltransferase
MYNRNNDKFNGDLLKAEIARANELGKAIDVSELTPFDKANIEFVNQFKDGVEVESFRNQIKRIFELAGLNYELEKSRWWAKYHQKQNKRD